MKYLFTIAFVLALFMARAATIEVGAGKACSTVKAGLFAAREGDTLLIYKGLYKEGELVVVKGVTIRGVGWPVLDGQGKSQVLKIQANRVSVEGLEIRNAGYSSSYDWAGVKVVNCNNVVIRNNRLFNNAFGIYFQNTSYSEIANNIIRGNTTDEVESGNAIHCWKSDHLTISGNNVSAHRDGIYFEFVTASLIKNNTSFNNLRYGIHFMFSNNDSYIQNTFRSNGSGVAVMFSKKVIMRDNHFEENWGGAAYGILMKEISDGVVEHNVFVRNTVGIYMEGTSRIIVSKNIFKSNGWAMRVQASCDNNAITRNNYFGNTFDVGTNGVTQLNKFINNYWDKYEGYDLNKDGYGDVHYLPVSLYSMIVEKMPSTSLLLRSFMVSIMDKAERLIPSITPVQLNDDKPLMKPIAL